MLFVGFLHLFHCPHCHPLGCRKQRGVRILEFYLSYAHNLRWVPIEWASRGKGCFPVLLLIRLPVQGTRVRALVWEDPTCRGAAGPVSHNY